MNLFADGTIRISGKTLGELALREFCARCFWIKLRLNDDPPFLIPIPGIFPSIDSFSTNFIRRYLDEYGRLPDDLSSIGGGNITRYSKQIWFSYHEPAYRITLTGRADDILVARNGDRHMIDYKTARHTRTQDRLFAMYQVQLNAYAYASELAKTHPPMKSLTLIYYEPPTPGGHAAGDPDNRTDTGFKMPYASDVVPVELDLNMIPYLLFKVRAIADLKFPPVGAENCKGCLRLVNLYRVAPPDVESTLESALGQGARFLNLQKIRERREHGDG